MAKTIKTMFGPLLAVLLSVLTAVSFSAVNVAASDAEQSAEDLIWDLPYAGIRFTVPEEYRNAKGVVTVGMSGEVAEGTGIYITQLFYVAMPQEEFDALMENDDPTEEELDNFGSKVYPVADLFGIDGNRSKEDLSSIFSDFDECIETMYEVGKVQDHTFYLYQETFDDLSSLGEYEEEFRYFSEHPELIIDNIEFSVPKKAGDFSGQEALSFETCDVFGNPVSSLDLFAKNRITMINIWTTWCIYCVEEMPELEKLNTLFQEDGCGIIGLLFDGNKTGAQEKAKEIMKTAGVTYPVIMPWDGYDEYFQIEAFPTTVFVDSQGNIVGETVMGADVDAYVAAMADALEQIGE